MLQSEIAKYLDEQDIVSFDETGTSGDCFIEVLPTEPDNVVSIYMNSGTQADSKLPYDNPSLQIIIRGKYDPRVPFNKAQDIYNELHGFSSDTLIDGGYWIIGIMGEQSGPVRLGQDDNGRQEFEVNFEIMYMNKSKWRS